MSAKNEKMKETIRKALAGQPTGLTSLDIRERGEITNAAACMTALMQMKTAGEILAHAGETARSTRYSLNPQFDGAAPPQRRKATKKKAKKGGRKPRASRPAAPVEPTAKEFIPAMAADSSLVLVAPGRFQMFSPEETVAIATLLKQHFE